MFKRLFITFAFLLLVIALTIPVIYAQEGTEEAPEGTAEVPEGTAEVPDGTAEVPEGTAEATEPSGDATSTTVALPTDTPTITLTPSLTFTPSATFTATFVPTAVPPTAIPGPPYFCDSSTLMLLFLAQTYGFSQSQAALQFNLADYDLGALKPIFDQIQPVTDVIIDTVLTDPTRQQEFLTFASQIAVDDLASVQDIQLLLAAINDIRPIDEHPSCLSLRDTLLDFLLVNIIYQQMQLRMVEG